MLDLLKESLAIYTLPATVLLVICLVYWGFVLLGMLDFDTFDFGGDLDGGAEVEGGAETSQGSNFWNSLIQFFNMVEIPAIIFLSILALGWWFTTISLNSSLNVAKSGIVGFLILVGCFVGCLFVTKLVTQPLKPLFKRLYDGEEKIEVVGKEAVVKSSQVDTEFGQVEMEKDGAPLLLNARTGEGDEPISKGKTVIIYREDSETGIYFVRET